MEKISSPEAYIERNLEWKELLESLRDILLESGLEEKMKWSIPTYCVDNKNVVGLAAFKEYCGLWFFYGAILSDLPTMEATLFGLLSGTQMRLIQSSSGYHTTMPWRKKRCAR